MIMNKNFKILVVLAAFACGFTHIQAQAPAESNGQRLLFDAQNPSVHDAAMAYCDGKYYVFSTGTGIPCMSSNNMKTWKQEKPVFNKTPKWVSKVVTGNVNGIWAPDIQYYDGLWYLFYSCSTFGKNTSAIGVAVNKTLNPENPDFEWVDKGMVLKSMPSDNFNAIDPNLVIDKKGETWLSFGSFWDGIQLVKINLNLPTDQMIVGKPKTIARRFHRVVTEDDLPSENSSLAKKYPEAGPNAIEAPFIVKNGKYYYLFASWDYCCRGDQSNYMTVVGRSKNIKGPYLDSRGVRMDEGGGDIILRRNMDFHGIGHCGVYEINGQWYVTSHGYDKNDNAKPKLVIRKIIFNSEGWPEICGDDNSVCADVNDPLYGKTICVLGDGYVTNGTLPVAETWHSKVAVKHGMNYVNCGFDDVSLAFERKGMSKSLVQLYAQRIPENADMVLVIAGHLDAYHIQNNESQLRFFEYALDYLLKVLKDKYKNVGYVTPWNVNQPGFAGVCKVIKKVCKANKIPVLNNFKDDCVIKVRDDKFRQRYFQDRKDNQHLNSLGHDMYVPIGEEFIVKKLGYGK